MKFKLIYLLFNLPIFSTLYLILNVDLTILNESFQMGLIAHLIANLIIFIGIILALSSFLDLMKTRLGFQSKEYVGDMFSFSSALLGIIITCLIVIASYRVTSYGEWYQSIRSTTSLIGRIDSLRTNKSNENILNALELANKNGNSEVKALTQKSYDDFQKLIIFAN